MALRIVLDTNTIISALFWKGNEYRLLDTIEKGIVSLYITHEILKELEEVIKRPKFRYIIEKADLTHEQIIYKIMSMSNMVITDTKVNICRDVKDNKLLECALSAKADYIVSGDDDLLTMQEYEGIQIINSRQMIKYLSQNRNFF